MLLHEFQQFLVCAAFTIAALAARGQAWAATYRRLALGLMVGLAILTISNLGILQGLYQSGGVYDLIFILPFAFFAWAAASAPASSEADEAVTDEAATPSRPWVIFAALGALPLVDFALRKAIPIEGMEGFRDLSMVITIFSVLPLLVARLAVQSSEARQADCRRLLLATATEQSEDLISIMTPAGQIEYANTAFCRALGYEAKDVRRMTLSRVRCRRIGLAARRDLRRGTRRRCVAWHVDAAAPGRVDVSFHLQRRRAQRRCRHADELRGRRTRHHAARSSFETS